MRVFKFILLKSSAIVLLLSCETVSELRLPDKSPKPTVNCVFHPDSVWFMRITMSKPVSENSPDPFEQVKNASVMVKSDDGQSFEIPYFIFQNGEVVFREGYRSASFRPQIGRSYTLEASLPGHETVIAQSSVPLPVEIDAVTIVSPIVEDESIHAKIHFTDPPGTNNYYTIAVYYVSEFTYNQGDEQITRLNFNPANLEMEDVNRPLEGGYRSETELLFDDNLLDGLAYVAPIVILPSHNFENDKKIIFCLRSVSRDYYLFKKTKLLQFKAEGNPFSQPVQVYNNIENGFGLFGGYSESRFEYVK